MINVVPEISILMPVFNMSGYLEECIRSIQHQKNISWELIAVDDFSTDDSRQKLERLANENSRIHIFQNRKKGIIPALALAFEKSAGTYITRMDADDLMPADKLFMLYERARKNRKTVATGRVQYFSDSAVSEGYLRYQNWLNTVAEKNDFAVNIYRECVIASPNWMVHRACFEKDITLDSLQYPEDYDLVFKWYQNEYSFESVQQLTHLWREHPARTSRHSEIYQQQTFFKLKTNYFIDLELQDSTYVQLIGAGIKGKLVAAVLTARNITFDWFEYGKKSDAIKSVEELNNQHKAILTNWPVDEKQQSEILRFLESKKLVLGDNVWLF